VSCLSLKCFPQKNAKKADNKIYEKVFRYLLSDKQDNTHAFYLVTNCGDN